MMTEVVILDLQTWTWIFLDAIMHLLLTSTTSSKVVKKIRQVTKELKVLRPKKSGDLSSVGDCKVMVVLFVFIYQGRRTGGRLST